MLTIDKIVFKSLRPIFVDTLLASWFTKEKNVNKKGSVDDIKWGLEGRDSGKNSNIISGFQVGELYPLSFLDMQARIHMFQDGSIKDFFQTLEWLQAREVVKTEVLAFTPAIDI